MATESRRSFNAQMLGSLMTYGLIESLFKQELFADSVKPVIQQWLADLNTLGRDVKDRKIKDTEWQAKVEELYQKVDLAELVKLLNLDGVARSVRYPEKGAANLGVDLAKIDGLPPRLSFGKQIFAMQRGRSVVPHGHVNMCTGFIILRGTFVGKHYDRVEDHADHYLIKPTIDRTFKPGECSTVSDVKDNVHWFKAESDTAFIFNIHILGYNPESQKPTGRVYVDPEGEKTAGGLIVAKKISSAESHRKYG
jgi:hypothetical protein